MENGQDFAVKLLTARDVYLYYGDAYVAMNGHAMTALSHLFTIVVTLSHVRAATIALITSDAVVSSTGQTANFMLESPINPYTAVHRCIETNADNGNMGSR